MAYGVYSDDNPEVDKISTGMELGSGAHILFVANTENPLVSRALLSDTSFNIRNAYEFAKGIEFTLMQIFPKEADNIVCRFRCKHTGLNICTLRNYQFKELYICDDKGVIQHIIPLVNNIQIRKL